MVSKALMMELGDAFYKKRPIERYDPKTNTFDPTTYEWHSAVVRWASYLRRNVPGFNTLEFFQACGAI